MMTDLPSAFRPTILENDRVRLEPLNHAHANDLERVAFDPHIWRYTVATIADRPGLDAYIEEAMGKQQAGEQLPFATIDKASGRAVGCSRFCFSPNSIASRRVEIGWTWLGRDYQRTGLNRAAKLLMLTHAFEAMQCIRVELLVHPDNTASRRAVLALGATEEGTLRNRQILPGPPQQIMSWVYYSILKEEWPAVRLRLSSGLIPR